MTHSSQHLDEHSYSPGSDVSIIRREFVELTGNLFSAVILNQLLYWTLRVKDFDYLLEEERKYQPSCNVSPRHGWIYKKAEELNEETMLGLSPPSIRKYLKLLIDEGWVDERDHPTERWNKTTQYRVNVRRLQEDLNHQGHVLPELYLKAFRGTFQRKPLTQQNTLENVEETSDEKNFSSNEKIFASNKRIFASEENSEDSSEEEPYLPNENLNQRIFASKIKNFGSGEKFFASKEKNFGSNEKFFGSNTEDTTKTTHKNTSKEQLAACARENFSDPEEYPTDELVLREPVVDGLMLGESISEGISVDGSTPNEAIQNEPIRGKSLEDASGGQSRADQSGDLSPMEEMVSLWAQHVVQHLPPDAAEAERRQGLHLTEERKDKLNSLLAFHFQNDMRLWERFCLRVKASSFLMGHGARKWCVGLDWLLKDENFSKVLSGKYDNSGAEFRDACDWKLEKLQTNPALNAEKAEIVASIKDPVWREWCSKLAAGVRYNDTKMLYEPLSVFELEQIANAWFLEVEDERLVWVGSSDQRVLNKIDNLYRKINWVFEKEYPKASTFRTRLVSQPSYQNPDSQVGGGSHE